MTYLVLGYAVATVLLFGYLGVTIIQLRNQERR